MGMFDLSGNVAIIAGSTRDRSRDSRCTCHGMRAGGYFELQPAAEAAAKSTIALGRMGKAEDTAESAMLLAPKVGSGITGRYFAMDGGMTIASSI